MAFVLRDATADDYPLFARLFPALAVDDTLLTPEQFAARMLPRVAILEEAGVPIGYVYWQIYGAKARVSQLVVVERARGRGAGRVLLEEARRRVRAARCSRWSLTVRQGNVPAIRLYEGCGLAIEEEGWLMRAQWSHLRALPGPHGDVVAYTPESVDDPILVARFGETAERLSILRSREGVVLLGLREAGVPVAFAGFDPFLPGVYPIRLARVDLARPLFDGLAPHAREDHLLLSVEGDHALRDVLQACEAEVRHEVYRMGAALQ